MALINFTINGKKAAAERGKMLLPLIREKGIDVPSLCYLDHISSYGACRLCLVEVKVRGKSFITTSCNYAINTEGTEVTTDNEKVHRLRRNVIELIWARNPEATRVEEMARKMGVEKPRYPIEKGNGKCILCGICVRVCDEVVGVHALTFSSRGSCRQLGTPFDEPSTTCIGCGACFFSCPTDAIEMSESDGVREIWGRKFEMEKCARCGKHFAPKFQVDYLAAKFKTSRETMSRCMTCRGMKK